MIIGSIVWLFKWGTFPGGNRYAENIAAIGASVEAFLGAEAGSLDLSTLATTDGWSLLVDTANKAEFQTVTDVFGGIDVDIDGINPGALSMEVGGFTYEVEFQQNVGTKAVPSFVRIENLPTDYLDYTIELEEDVSGSWEVGDEVVIASTDYDWEQAER